MTEGEILRNVLETGGRSNLGISFSILQSHSHSNWVSFYFRPSNRQFTFFFPILLYLFGFCLFSLPFLSFSFQFLFRVFTFDSLLVFFVLFFCLFRCLHGLLLSLFSSTPFPLLSPFSSCSFLVCLIDIYFVPSQ